MASVFVVLERSVVVFNHPPPIQLFLVFFEVGLCLCCFQRVLSSFPVTEVARRISRWLVLDLSVVSSGTKVVFSVVVARVVGCQRSDCQQVLRPPIWLLVRVDMHYTYPVRSFSYSISRIRIT